MHFVRNRVHLAMWLLALFYLLLHGIVATCFPDRLAPLSTLLIVLTEWAAAAFALLASRKIGSAARILWWLLACSCVLESTAMSLDMLNEIRGTSVFNSVPALSIFFSTLYDVPLLAAVSIQFDRRVLSLAGATNAVLSLAVGALLNLQIFSLLSIQGSRNPGAAALILLLFDLIDLYLALAATARWLGANGPDERIFFCTTAIFLWANAVLPAIHNRILIHRDHVWLDLFLSAPYLLLIVLIQSGRRRATQKPRSTIVDLVQSGSPIFLSLALLVTGVVVARTHFYVGLAAALLSVIGYRLQNTVSQSLS